MTGHFFRHCFQEHRQMVWKRLSCVLALASPELLYFFSPGKETTLPMSLHICTTLGKVLEASKVWQDSWDTLRPVTSPKSGSTICQAQHRPLKEFWSFKDWENTFQIFPMPHEHLPEKTYQNKGQGGVSAVNHEKKQEQDMVIPQRGPETGRRLWHWSRCRFC